MPTPQVLVSYRGLREDSCQQLATGWGELVSWLHTSSSQAIPSRLDVPLFTFATFSGGIHKHHVTSITGAMLDYDGTSHEQLVEVVTRARAFRGFAYTSYNHTLKGEPPCRFRVAIAFDEPCPPDQWERVWRKLANLLGIYTSKAPDTSTRDPGRFFFIPAQNPQGPPTWFSHWDGPPLCLRALLADPDPQEMAVEDELEGTELVTLANVHSLSQRLQRKGSSELQTIGRQIENALRGTEFVLEGNRDNQCWKLAGEIGKAFPRASAPHLAEFFRSALELQGEPSVETFSAQIRRQQHTALRIEAQKKGLRKDRQGEPVAAPTPQDPNAPQLPPAVNDIPLIVQFKKQYWVRDIYSRDYISTYSQSDIEIAIQRTYAPFEEQGVVIRGQDNEVFPLRKLCSMYSSPAKEVEASYLATENNYNPGTQVLTLAPARRRKLTPKPWPDVAQWLQNLAGPAYPDLEAWLKGLARLDMPSPALYLWGKKNVGKTLLAYGLSQIWEHDLCTIQDAQNSFNSKLQENPLILADEGFPSDTSFTWLRSFLSTARRPVNAKYAAPYQLHGHVRMIVTANNPAAFDMGTRKALTFEDANAISERVMQIEVCQKASDYLESLGSVRHWVTENRIAEHVLHLMGQPAEPVTGRWVVRQKHVDPLSFAARITEKTYDWFCHWVAQYISNPKIIEGRYAANLLAPWYLRTYQGRMLIHPMCLEYFDRFDKRTAYELKNAIGYFCDEGRVNLRVHGNPARKIWYRVVDVNRLYASIKEQVDDGTLTEMLATDTERRLGFKD